MAPPTGGPSGEAAGRTPAKASKRSSETSPPAWNPKLLLLTAVVYGAVFYVTHKAFARVPTPLPRDASPKAFSEGRALKHTAYLSDRVGERQVSTAGEEEAAQYLLRHARHMAAEARKHRPDLHVEVERQQVTGGVTMSAFKFDIANVYNNLTNIVIRIAPRGAAAAKTKAVLVNAHYDSTLGTAGASDAASCVGVALELARTLIANRDLQLQSPVVVLLNGGEETLSQAANGFMQSSKYAKDLGAFINLESTGPWGPDVVFQHTGDWALQAYARAAPSPRGTTVAQDFFELGLIPADTDYRMFSHRHYGSLPGIDIAFVFDGTAYHTQRDEVDRIRPGTLQAMGDNVLAAVLEFSRVLATRPPAPSPATSNGLVYFDLLGKVMVVYPHWLANILHSAPLVALLLLGVASTLSTPPRAAGRPAPAGRPTLTTLGVEALVALASLLCAMALPAAIGAVRAYRTRTPYVWYGKPEVAYAIYVPAAVAGLMLPYVFVPFQKRAARAHTQSLGSALLFALVSAALTRIGMHSAFLYAFWAASATLAGLVLGGSRRQPGWGATLVLLALAVVPIAVCMPTALSIMAHIMEKIGLGGAVPGRIGLWLVDGALGIVAGTAALLALGTLTPYVVAGLGKAGRTTVFLLLAASIGSAIWASRTYVGPKGVYSYRHPKRILMQHIHKHTPEGHVFDSKYSLVQLDNYPLTKLVHKSVVHSQRAPYSNADWESFYPLNHLVAGIARVAPGPEPHPVVPRPPRLTLLHRELVTPPGTPEDSMMERLDLELDTGIGAWAVMNLTGDITSWSLSDRVAHTVKAGNRSTHMVRYAANGASPKYVFWVEMPAGATLDVTLHVKYMPLTPELSNTKNQLSGLLSVAAVTTYQSRWSFGPAQQAEQPAAPSDDARPNLEAAILAHEEGAGRGQPAEAAATDAPAASTPAAPPREGEAADAPPPEPELGVLRDDELMSVEIKEMTLPDDEDDEEGEQPEVTVTVGEIVMAGDEEEGDEGEDDDFVSRMLGEEGQDILAGAGLGGEAQQAEQQAGQHQEL